MNTRILIAVSLTGILIAGSFPWKSDLIFSHKQHIEEEELECIDCHQKAETSTSGRDDLLAAEASCRDCHEEQDTECVMCHKGPEEPALSPRITNYSAKFNHLLHTEQAGMECLDCHSGVETTVEISSALHLPKMENCMECHVTPAELQGCYTCHTTDEELRPADHTIAWGEMHGMAAASGAQTCNSCHRENYCMDCHQGENIAGFSHNADFMINHAQKFITRESDCAACHQTRQFCIDCHMNTNRILPVSHNSPDWTGQEHAIEARIDFEQCSVCHTNREPSCIECHN